MQAIIGCKDKNIAANHRNMACSGVFGVPKVIA